MKLTGKLLLSAACLMIGAGAQAATIGGTLAGHQGETPSALEPLPLTGAPYDFQAGFVDEDDAGVFQFDFVNTLDSLAIVTLADFTILQNNNELFEGGVTTTFGDMVEVTMGGELGSFVLEAMVGAGEMISLVIDYGNPIGNMGSLGEVGPDIDFIVNAAPIPVPAAMPLLAAGLGALGFVARRRKKASAA